MCRIIVVMGAAGAGKTTVGRALADALGWAFHDADDLHDAASVAKMRAGLPLTDADREPWLARVRQQIEEAAGSGGSAVVACSALRERYRRSIAAGRTDVRFVYLRAARDLLRARVAQRQAHFMPADLVDSQLAALEPPGDEAITVDAATSVPHAVERIRAMLLEPEPRTSNPEPGTEHEPSSEKREARTGGSTMPPIHIIGVPLDLGGNRRGVDMGPSAFRIAGIGAQIAALGRLVVDKGDLPAPIPETQGPTDPRQKYVREIAGVCRLLHAAVLESLEGDALPVVLGGDHSLAAGSVAASADWVRRTTGLPLGVIWLDAHGDINTPETTTSGNVHGMPLAALLGQAPAELAAIGTSPSIQPGHTVLIGIRNLDEQEKRQIREAGVHVFTMKDIDRDGIAAIAERAIALASAGTGGIHASVDLDVCDPLVAPGVGTPVKGGLDYREAHMVMELLADSGRLVGLDLVEVNPTLDVRNTTAEFGTELALSALGKRIL